MCIVIGAAAVVIGTGVGFYKYRHQKGKAQPGLTPAQAKALQVPFPQMTSNLKDDGLIQFTAVLQASDSGTKAEIVDLEPQIEDIFNQTTRQFTSDELRQVQGYQALKRKIQSGVNRLLPQGSVTAVYLEDTLVQ